MCPAGERVCWPGLLGCLAQNAENQHDRLRNRELSIGQKEIWWLRYCFPFWKAPSLSSRNLLVASLLYPSLLLRICYMPLTASNMSLMPIHGHELGTYLLSKTPYVWMLIRKLLRCIVHVCITPSHFGGGFVLRIPSFFASSPPFDLTWP